MAHHKSAIKAHEKSVEREKRNKSIKSSVKTYIKKFEAAMSSGNVVEANIAFNEAQSKIMSSVSKGALKKKTASNRVSKLSKLLKKLSA